MALNAFHTAANDIVKNMMDAGALLSVDAIRGWLDDAPMQASSQSVPIWGTFVFTLFRTVHDYPMHKDAQDDLRLVAYLNALGPHNVTGAEDQYELLSRLFLYFDAHERSGGLNPLRTAIVKHGWSPNGLAQWLDKTPVLEAYGHNAQHALFKALWPLMQDGAWQPANSIVYAGMWNHLSAMRRGTSDEKSCIHTLVQTAPCLLVPMLEALSNHTGLAPEALESFFPLHYENGNAQEVLDWMLQIMLEGGRDDLTYKARGFTELVEQYHPKLMALLNVHLSLLPNANETCTYAAMSVPALEALRGTLVSEATHNMLPEDFLVDAP